MVRAFISERIHEITYVGLSFSAAALNYLVYPMILRLLEASSASSGISILNISSQLGGVFTISTILSMYASTLEHGEKKFLISSRKYLNILFVATLVVFIASSQELKSVIGGSTVLTFCGVALLSYLSVIAGGWMGTLNARRKFVASGSYLLGSSFLQLVFSYFTVKYIYPSVNGLVLSFLAGYIIPFLTLMFYMRKFSEKSTATMSFDKSSLIKRVMFSFIVYLVLWYAQSFELYMAYKLPESISNDYIAATIYPKTIFFIGFIYIWTVVPRIIRYARVPFSQVQRITLQLALILTPISTLFILCAPLLNKIISGRSLNIDMADLAAMLIFKVLFSVLSLYFVIYLSRGKYSQLILPACIIATVMTLMVVLVASFLIALAIGSLVVLFISVYLAYNMVNEKHRT